LDAPLVAMASGVAGEPVLAYSVPPRYTEQAMRARLQGVVELDAVAVPVRVELTFTIR
jgi:hypothetical protein